MRMKKVLISYMLVIQILASLNILTVNTASSVNMRVEQVVWGTSPDNPITVSPGDVNQPLTVIVINLAENTTIKGISANLTLEYPFRSSSGGFVAQATGSPREQDVISPTGEVSPGGSFSLTFRLDIDQDAKPGSYYYTMIVHYMVRESQNIYRAGEPQELMVKIFLQDRAPMIDSFTPRQTNPTLYIGDNLNFSSQCHDPDGDNLTFRWLLDGKIVSNSSSFIYAPAVQDAGTRTVELRVSDGNLTTSQTWNVLVDKMLNIEVFVPYNFLVGGSKTLLNITLKNNLWKGMVQVDFSAPQPQSSQLPPLVVYGNHSWILNSIKPGDFISIYPEIFTPSLYTGMTYTSTLTVAYNDEYGRSHTDTISIGLIIRGRLSLKVYDVKVSPQPAQSGSAFTLSATILNMGNIPASHVNASIDYNVILAESDDRASYIGQVDVNSPSPFSVGATLRPGIEEGNYTLTFTITYEDDLQMKHSFSRDFNLMVKKVNTHQSYTTEEREILGLPFDAVLIIIILAISSLATYVLFRQIRKRQRKS